MEKEAGKKAKRANAGIKRKIKSGNYDPDDLTTDQQTQLADKDKEISRAYEVLIKKKMYGREYMGIGRMSFLIDEEGKIEKIWNPVDPNGHAQEVLDLVIK